MTTGIIIRSAQDTLAMALQILEAAKDEIIWHVPVALFSLSVSYGYVEKTRAFIQQGGMTRGIVPISPANVREVEVCLECGEDVRHSDEESELFMFVGDRQQGVSSMNTGAGEYTLATPVIVFWSEDPVYVGYLLDTFERAWSRSIPAAERIRSLSEEETHQA
ncbi:MAG: hypothetical protein ACXV4C_09040 [Halobacteriota archaeon]